MTPLVVAGSIVFLEKLLVKLHIGRTSGLYENDFLLYTMQRVSILSIVKKKCDVKKDVYQPPIVQQPVSVGPTYIVQKVCASCDAIYIEQ